MSAAEDDQVYDEGLQPERTLLAWRRTALAIAVVAAVGIRFTTPALGWLAVALGSLGITLGLLAYVASGLGYRRVHAELVSADQHPGNGWPQILLTAAVLVVGLTALLYVLLPN